MSKCKCGDCVRCLSPLPEGKTCADCVHVYRCVKMFGQQPGETACQFIPNRWNPKPEVSHVG